MDDSLVPVVLKQAREKHADVILRPFFINVRFARAAVSRFWPREQIFKALSTRADKATAMETCL
jgi:hypothetical protein